MNILQAVILGIIQGASEFIPVSSSGHLVLVPWLLGWEAPSLTFIVAAHWGTMIAVLTHFWSDWMRLLNGGLALLRDRRGPNPEAQMLLVLVIGTIPAAIVGFFLSNTVDAMTSQPIPASIFLLVTALILFANSMHTRPSNSDQRLDWRDGIFIGLAQALAVFAGISRSGITIAAGRVRGLDNEGAARFSFLLATPAILGAGILGLVAFLREGDWVSELPALVTGFVSAAIVGYLSIRWLLDYLKKHSTLPFAIYCAVAGLLGLLVVAIRGG